MNTVVASENTVLRRSRLVSNVLHPWAVLVPVVVLAAYQATGEPLECTKWALLTFVPAFAFSLLYAKIMAVRLSRAGNPQKISRSLVRDKPTQLLIMPALFGVPSALILHYLNGPKNLFVII